MDVDDDFGDVYDACPSASSNTGTAGAQESVDNDKDSAVMRHEAAEEDENEADLYGGVDLYTMESHNSGGTPGGMPGGEVGGGASDWASPSEAGREDPMLISMEQDEDEDEGDEEDEMCVMVDDADDPDDFQIVLDEPSPATSPMAGFVRPQDPTDHKLMPGAKPRALHESPLPAQHPNSKSRTWIRPGATVEQSKPSALEGQAGVFAVPGVDGRVAGKAGGGVAPSSRGPAPSARATQQEEEIPEAPWQGNDGPLIGRYDEQGRRILPGGRGGMKFIPPEEYKEFISLGHGAVFDLEVGNTDETPWRDFGADISAFFNYGLNERTWKVYAKQVRQARVEMMHQGTIQTFETTNTGYDPEFPPELAAAMAPEAMRASMGGASVFQSQMAFAAYAQVYQNNNAAVPSQQPYGEGIIEYPSDDDVIIHLSPESSDSDVESEPAAEIAIGGNVAFKPDDDDQVLVGPHEECDGKAAAGGGGGGGGDGGGGDGDGDGDGDGGGGSMDEDRAGKQDGYVENAGDTSEEEEELEEEQLEQDGADDLDGGAQEGVKRKKMDRKTARRTADAERHTNRTYIDVDLCASQHQPKSLLEMSETDEDYTELEMSETDEDYTEQQNGDKRTKL